MSVSREYAFIGCSNQTGNYHVLSDEQTTVIVCEFSGTPAPNHDSLMLSSELLQRSNLTQSQALFWLGHRLQQDVPLDTHTTTFAFTIFGAVDPPRFRAASQRVVDDSDALRSVIVEVDGVPQRLTRQELASPLPLIDLSGHADAAGAVASWIRCRQAERREGLDRPFD